MLGASDLNEDDCNAMLEHVTQGAESVAEILDQEDLHEETATNTMINGQTDQTKKQRVECKLRFC